jgi:hypothetical protein
LFLASSRSTRSRVPRASAGIKKIKKKKAKRKEEKNIDGWIDWKETTAGEPPSGGPRLHLVSPSPNNQRKPPPSLSFFFLFFLSKKFSMPALDNDDDYPSSCAWPERERKMEGEV